MGAAVRGAPPDSAPGLRRRPESNRCKRLCRLRGKGPFRSTARCQVLSVALSSVRTAPGSGDIRGDILHVGRRLRAAAFTAWLVMEIPLSRGVMLVPHVRLDHVRVEHGDRDQRSDAPIVEADAAARLPSTPGGGTSAAATAPARATNAGVQLVLGALLMPSPLVVAAKSGGASAVTCATGPASLTWASGCRPAPRRRWRPGHRDSRRRRPALRSACRSRCPAP